MDSETSTMSVLKGASAAALYGSRAGNGVIQITTKRGRRGEGLGVTISSSVGVESLFMVPRLQNEFGQGTEGAYRATSTTSWGPRIEGQEYTKWDGTKARMQSYDNVAAYFRTGIDLTENIAFSQQYDRTSIYTSLTRTDNQSHIPGASLGLITVNALTAADSVIIPVQCEYFALEGITQLLNTIRMIKMHLNPDLEIEGFLLTMYDRRLRLANQIYDEVKRHFQELVFKTVIQRNVKLSEAPSHGIPAILYDAESIGAVNHLSLAREIIQRNS